MNRRDFLKRAGVGIAGLYVGKDLLGLGAPPASAAVSDGSVVGEVRPFVGASVPPGWLICDGSAVPRAEYAKLHAVLGDAYGSDGRSRFRLPDFRGRLLLGHHHASTPTHFVIKAA